MAQPQIHLLVDEPIVPPEIAKALQRIDAGVRLSALEHEFDHPSNIPADARLVVTSNNRAGSSRRLQTLFEHWGNSPCATLVLTRSSAGEPVDPPPAGALPVDFASELSTDELVGRLASMCAFHQPLNNLNHEVTELRQRDLRHAQSAHQLDEQLRLASQIQQDLLPDPLPVIHGARLHTLFRPVERVSGDMYDVIRLDDTHLGLSVVDATGHGIPAALLTMFIKRTMRGTETRRATDRLDTPDQVLRQLNREILDADLTHCQFVTGLYAIYAEDTRTLCWSRGGTPLPILVRRGRPPQQLNSDGMLLGADRDAEFECREVSLEPGDTVIFHTDGLDALLLERDQDANFDDVRETPWYRSLQTGSVADRLNAIADLAADTPRSCWPADDLTVLALEIN